VSGVPVSMRKILDGYYRLLIWLLVASVAILVFPVSLQVFSRYTQLLPHYIWTEEMARFLFIWMVMLGAMIAVRENSHFDVDIWPDMGPKPTAMLRIISQFFVLVMSIVFTYWGYIFLKFGWDQTSELADLPMPFIFVAWPVAGITWIVFLGEAFVKNVRILAGKAAS
jgi:TRAP-type transport system small permease protein